MESTYVVMTSALLRTYYTRERVRFFLFIVYCILSNAKFSLSVAFKKCTEHRVLYALHQ